MINNTTPLNLDELKRIVWNFADTIRDNGHGDVSNYMPITIGTLMLKRLIDERTHYKKHIVDTKGSMLVNYNDNNIDTFIANTQTGMPSFSVHDKAIWSYRLDWNDIACFPDNRDRIYPKLEYTDLMYIEKNGVNVTNRTYTPVDEDNMPILTRTDLVRYLTHTFVNELCARMFNVFNFTSLIGQRTNGNNIVLDEKYYDNILNYLNNYDFSIQGASQDIFAEVYMDLLGRFAADGGKKGGEFFTPTPVVRGAIKFADFDRSLSHVKIGDPAAGACSFMIEAVNAFTKGDASKKDSIEVVVGEKNALSGVIGGMNISLHGIKRSQMFFEDSIRDYRNHLGQYAHQIDYVFANPPYGLRDYGRNDINENDAIWEYGVPKKSDGDFAFLEIILNMMNDRGQAVVVMPMGTLFKGATHDLRKNILNTGWVSGIVALPEKMFQTTGIQVCLWVFNKKRAESSHIMMINAFEDFVRDGNYNVWNSELSDKAAKAYHEHLDIEGYSRLVPYSEIVDNDYSLSLDKYIDTNEQEEIIDIQTVRSNMKSLRMDLFADLITIENSLGE